MIARKGLEILLLAAAELVREAEDFFLIIEGDGPLRKNFETMSEKLNLINNVIFVGFSQMDRHAYFLGLSDIVVVPSIDDPWGIVVQEGMLMGKAVCASDAVGSANDMIQDGINGIIFPAGDWRTLATKLKILLQHRTMRVELGEHAKYSSAAWSPKRNIDNLLQRLRKEPSIKL